MVLECNYTETVGPRREEGGGAGDPVVETSGTGQCRSQVMDVNTGSSRSGCC